MINDIFRYDEHVPSAYLKESRDMQMMLRLWTYGLNASKFEAEQIQFLNDPELCSDRILTLLSEKVQFMDSKDIRSDILRIIDKNFAGLIRTKGTEQAICSAVYLFLKAYKMYTETIIYYDNTTYDLWIGINSAIRDVSVLETILKYIVPTGYLIHIYFYEDVNIRMGFRFNNKMSYLRLEHTNQNMIYYIKKNSNSSIKAIKYPTMESIQLTSLVYVEKDSNNNIIYKSDEEYDDGIEPEIIITV